MSSKLVDAIANMREEEALALARERLSRREDPMAVLDDCRAAMEIVGKKFEKGEYFLPELILAGEMFKAISAEAKPYIGQGAVGRVRKHGKVLIGTVKGDIHDIGKDIVTFMLDVNGFEVKDLGVDVPPGKFVEEARTFRPDIVALSGFLTIAYGSMKETVEALKAAGLRDKVKIMVGGGTVDDHVRAYAGADAWGPDAMAAVTLAKQWMGVK